MTEFMKDILKQPQELINSLNLLLGPEKATMNEAADLIRHTKNLFITGIGSSWHGGMAVQHLFHTGGLPACLIEASELLQSIQVAKEAAVIVISRSGKSIEIVQLIDKLKAAKAKIIAVTNLPDSPLARGSDVTITVQATFDHQVSVTMYSALAMAGGLLAGLATGVDRPPLQQSLSQSLSAARGAIDSWMEQIQDHPWFTPEAGTYFLARGASLASAHETKLLWEEATKSPATAMTTGGFRHGSQEVSRESLRFGVWIDNERMRRQDLAVVADLRKLGVKVMLIGQGLPADSADLAFSLPSIVTDWQFLIDIIPAQLAAEHLSHVRGVDCDNFRICPYIVESDGGLLA
jgi:glucosamine--fructose-6-phosphate aminotransferase (isomerizing)